MIHTQEAFDKWDGSPFVGEHPAIGGDSVGFEVFGLDLDEAWARGKAMAFDLGWTVEGTVSRLVKVKTTVSAEDPLWAEAQLRIELT